MYVHNFTLPVRLYTQVVTVTMFKECFPFRSSWNVKNDISLTKVKEHSSLPSKHTETIHSLKGSLM